MRLCGVSILVVGVVTSSEVAVSCACSVIDYGDTDAGCVHANIYCMSLLTSAEHDDCYSVLLGVRVASLDSVSG